MFTFQFPTLRKESVKLILELRLVHRCAAGLLFQTRTLFIQHLQRRKS